MNSHLPKEVAFDDDNPEWSEEDFARARPASEFHSPEILKLLVRQKGRPKLAASAHKKAVSIRLDPEVVAFFKADGPGWQTRLNDFLASRIRKVPTPPTGE